MDAIFTSSNKNIKKIKTVDIRFIISVALIIYAGVGVIVFHALGR